jgi:hypothetical protein
MASLCFPTLADERVPAPVPANQERRLVASFGASLAADYAKRVAPNEAMSVDLTDRAAWAARHAELTSASVSACVLFLNSGWTENDRTALDVLLPFLSNATHIAVVSSFRVHLSDRKASISETEVLDRLKSLQARVVTFRPGHVLSESSPCSRMLRRFGFVYPLVPQRLRTCFIEAGALFDAIDHERDDPPEEQSRRGEGARPLRSRVITVLGRNEAWREQLRRHRPRGPLQAGLTALCYLAAVLLIGQLAAFVFGLLARLWPSLQRLNFDTLRPKYLAELLALCNRHNIEHVKVVGYNNGVVHFGHRYPGVTVVSTVHCNRLVRIATDIIRADCGVTIRQARAFVALAHQELPVIPNYSYVCLGTALFVPIHGSASDFTTVAETITQALFYDPLREQVILATSDDATFRNAAYNMASRLIVLRVWLRVKPSGRYLVRHEKCEQAGSDALLTALRDPEATNVEIRQSTASSPTVVVSRYYQAAGEPRAECLDVPRDAIGRLWDKLEENPLTSFLMHAMARRLIWHVELFFPPDDFGRFWADHRTFPLRKIQLRYIRQDALPYSPFRDHDCVSVDMFMFRWQRARFDAYLKQEFATVRSNPGKHSR